MKFLRSTLSIVSVIGVFALAPAGASALNYLDAPGSPITRGIPDDQVNAIATADFNGDGRADIVQVNRIQTIYINFGQANGTTTSSPAFGNGGPFSIPSRRAVAVGDVDGDGDIDIVAGGRESQLEYETFLNNGSGVFPSAPSYTLALPTAGATAPNGPVWASLTLADVNGDGKLDLLTGMFNHSYAVALGAGTGSFTAPGAPVSVPTSQNSTSDEIDSIAVGDFVGTSAVDLALVMSGPSGSSILVVPGNGTGTFTQPGSAVLTAVAGRPFASAARIHLNGDSLPDLSITQPLAGGRGENTGLTTLVGSASGLVANPNPAGTVDPGGRGAVQTVADMNGDGRQDIVVGLGDGVDGVGVVLSNGAGGLTAAGPFTFPRIGGSSRPFYPRSVAAGDFNGDGFRDLAANTTQDTPILGTSGTAIKLASASPSVNPTDLVFPQTYAGQSSPTYHMTLSNAVGAPPLNPATLDFDGGHSPAFTYDASDCNRTLAGGQSCDVAVTFNPQSTGSFVQRVYFRFGSQAGAITTIASGDTGYVRATIDPTSDMGSVVMNAIAGYEQPTQTFTVANTGTLPLAVSSTTLTGAGTFSIVPGTSCVGSVPVGGTCQIKVRFAPPLSTTAAEAVQTTHLTVEVPDYVNGPFEVNLYGNASIPWHQAEPSPADFGGAAIGSGGTTKTISLSSVGTGALPVNGYSITGPDASSFTAAPGQCPALLALHASCGIQVTFNPQSGAPGARNATLNLDVVSSRAVPKTVELSGTATPASNPGAGALSLKLKSAKKAKRGKKLAVKVTVTNTGKAPAESVVLRAKAPKKLGRAPKPVKVGTLAAGRSITKTLFIKVKKSAKKGKRLKVKITATFAGGKPVTLSTKAAKLR